MTDDSYTCALSIQQAELVAQLSGIIFLAQVAWQLSPKRLPHMARIFHFVAESDQAAALIMRTGVTAPLQINYNDISE